MKYLILDQCVPAWTALNVCLWLSMQVVKLSILHNALGLTNKAHSTKGLVSMNKVFVPIFLLETKASLRYKLGKKAILKLPPKVFFQRKVVPNCSIQAIQGKKRQKVCKKVASHGLLCLFKFTIRVLLDRQWPKIAIHFD